MMKETLDIQLHAKAQHQLRCCFMEYLDNVLFGYVADKLDRLEH
ncbi:hypothetical protein N9007_00730 [bacterium]|nr:hypothetical protein [bacterium]